MIRTLLQHKRRVAILCALLAIAGTWSAAFAQLDYDTYDIYQTAAGTERTLVGTIYVPPRASNQEVYSEYWVLFPNYTYPGQKNTIATEIVSSTHFHFMSVEDFFASVPWVTGSRYVHVIAVDTDRLPGRTPSAPGTN